MAPRAGSDGSLCIGCCIVRGAWGSAPLWHAAELRRAAAALGFCRGPAPPAELAARNPTRTGPGLPGLRAVRRRRRPLDVAVAVGAAIRACGLARRAGRRDSDATTTCTGTSATTATVGAGRGAPAPRSLGTPGLGPASRTPAPGRTRRGGRCRAAVRHLGAGRRGFALGHLCCRLGLAGKIANLWL